MTDFSVIGEDGRRIVRGYSEAAAREFANKLENDTGEKVRLEEDPADEQTPEEPNAAELLVAPEDVPVPADPLAPVEQDTSEPVKPKRKAARKRTAKKPAAKTTKKP